MTSIGLYCIALYLLPVLNPKSYDGARVLEASGRPMLGRSIVLYLQPVLNFKSYDGARVLEAMTSTGRRGALHTRDLP